MTKNSNAYRNELIQALKRIKCYPVSSSDKFIPENYKFGDRKSRLEILAGLIDTDGHLSKGYGYEFSSKSRMLANDVAFICRSIGLMANIGMCGPGKEYFRVSISGDLTEIPVRIKRKKCTSARKQIKNVLRTGFSVSVGIENERYYGVTLDGDQHYLLEDFIVTHNSLCFQLPAVAMAGTTIVISPLISLMKDQVDNAVKKGIDAIFINSDLSAEESRDAYAALLSGSVKLLYIAPERFAVDQFRGILPKIKIGSIITDESHCVEWGYDFRPAYLQVADYLKDFTAAPRAAFTASATVETQEDIIRRFGLRDPLRVRASFNRPNLHYSVIPKLGEGMIDVLEYIKTRRAQLCRGIIYRSTRIKTENTAEMLTRSGIDCLPYHAGLEPTIKQAHQDAFVKGEIRWICATIAFGMGIDVPDIRYVLHADLPKTMEGFYQETGRAGRDGNKSDCVLFYSAGDIKTIQYFIDQNFLKTNDGARKKRGEAQLRSMRHYAEKDICRRHQILAYFGEQLPGTNCMSCDVCKPDYVKNRFGIPIMDKTLF
jgi:RecQ family ATP-dependent DNA helicase